MAAVAALALAACLPGQTTTQRPTSGARTAATPTPTATTTAPISPAPPVGLIEQLKFSGDITASAATTAPDDQSAHTECTGPNSLRAGLYTLNLVLALNNARYQLVIKLQPYRGPSSYSDGITAILIALDQSIAYQNGDGDPVTFSVSGSEVSGLLDVTLSSARDARIKEHITGTWTCR